MTNVLSGKRWELVAMLVRQDVLRNRYPPGAVLAGTKALGERYGVCYRTLRKALTTLCREGVLTPQRKHYRVPAPAARGGANTVVLAARVNPAGGSQLMPDRSLALLRELEHACSLHGLTLEVVRMEYRPDGHLAPGMPRLLRPDGSGRSSVLGYLVWTIGFPQADALRLVQSLGRCGQPVAVLDETNALDRAAPRPAAAPLLVVSMAMSSRCGEQVGRYLLQRGHTAMAFITDDSTPQWVGRRMQGVVAACESYGLAGAVELVDLSSLCRVEPPVFDAGGVLAGSLPPLRRQALQSALSLHATRIRTALYRDLLLQRTGPALARLLSRRDVTAWIGANDFAALLCREYLGRRGVAVPGRVSLVGFDDSLEASLRNVNSYNFNYAGVTSAMLSFVTAGQAGAWRRRSAAPVEIEGSVVERGSVRAIT